MKMLRKIVLFGFISSLIIACKKEAIPPTAVVGQPVFYFNGTVNGSNVSLQAGINNYYMYSSYTQDTVGVYNFTGNLQSVSTNKNSIQITINDYKVLAPNTPAVIDTSLVPACYSYNMPGGNTTDYSVAFAPIIDSGVPSAPYIWTFGDGVISNAGTPTHIYTHPGDYNTSFDVQFIAGCNTNISNVVKMGTPDATINIRAIVVTNAGGGALAFIAAFTGPAKSFLWNFGDGTRTITASSIATHTYANPGMYLLSLTITDNNNYTTTFNEYIVTALYTTECVANYGTIITPLANPFSLSNVTINYTDVNGNVYTSNNASQPSTSTFQVLSVASYKNNLNNQTTKELKVQFNCMLYNGSNSIPASGIAVIAVAYR